MIQRGSTNVVLLVGDCDLGSLYADARADADIVLQLTGKTATVVKDRWGEAGASVRVLGLLPDDVRAVTDMQFELANLKLHTRELLTLLGDAWWRRAADVYEILAKLVD